MFCCSTPFGGIGTMKKAILSASLLLASAYGLAQSGRGDVVGLGTEVGEPVTAVSIDVDLRSLPVVPEWQPGDGIREAHKRQFHPLEVKDPSAPADWVTSPDLLDDQQELFDTIVGARNDTGFGRNARVNIDNGNTGVSPGDPVVEVSATHVMYGINNSSGTVFKIYDKAGALLAGPTTFKSLAPAGDPCATSVSDPIILFDRLANRWFLLEMGGTSSANRLCVYVSKTSNPVSGGWWFYGFSTPALPDYPHCNVWPNGYVCTDNESGTGAKVYAFDRENMLNGATARAAQRFTSVAKLSGYGFQALTPATMMGTTAPPSGAPIILARHNDDEAHSGTSANTTQDFIDLFSLNLNWTTPSSSSITTLPRIAISEFNSWFRDYSTFATVPQPSSTSRLDPIREVILNSMVYRNFGTYESIVGNFATNQNAARTGTTVDSGIRWFELRKSGSGNWALQQEGTYSPGDTSTHHLLGTIATDKQGNIGLGFNRTRTTTPTMFASLGYTGRLNTDSAGVMTQGENIVATGAAAETSGRWGDYYQMVVDPADDCTFWFIGMYRPTGSWATRATHFKFNNCGTITTTYSISGSVTNGSGTAESGVTISTGSSSASTSSTGAYSIAGLANGSYTLTPSKAGCTFSPTSRAVTVSSANVTGQNFTSTCTTQPSFFENQTDFTINDNATIESPVTVSGRTGNAPATLTVAVTIFHTYIGDLKVDLIAPDGSVYVLHNRSGGSADNIIRSYTVNASSELANGTWKLRVNDNANADTGRLDKWSLQF
jgi:hypothetical protein